MNINTTSDFENQTENMYDYINNNLLFNPILIGILFFVIIIYIILSYSLGNKQENIANNDFGMPFQSNYSSSTSTDVSSFSTIIGAIIFIIIIAIIIANAYFYYYGVSIITSINNLLFGNNLKIDILNDDDKNDDNNENINQNADIKQIKIKPQVFNIPSNTFTYQDAKAVCKSYGGELATYNQIEDAYNKGASWCSQGWSEGQNIFYPTQEKVFNDLQKIKGHEHDCGRIGINGGYISNPHAKFGVNCYAYKPVINQDEAYIMENKPIYPVTKEDILFQKRVDYWKKNIDDVIVSPFNQTTWSKL